MVNILFCGNSGVFDGMLTGMLSILKRTASSEPFTFYVFTMTLTRMKPDYTPVTEAQAEFLEEIAREYNPENRVKLIDVTELYETQFSKVLEK